MNFDFMTFIPQTGKEIAFTIIIVILLFCLLLWNKALMKCKEINTSYIEESRIFDKYLLLSQLEDDFEQFKNELAIKSVFGDKDV